MKPIPIAVAISDLHLSLLQPACRADKNWMEVQAEYLNQVSSIAGKHDIPVLCAGDIFDRWNPPPELINFALENLPTDMICVPGQHDLPNHRIDQMYRSGYGVLKRAGKIIDLSEDENRGLPVSYGGNLLFYAYGFGWNQKIVPPTIKETDYPNVAVIHKYCWTADTGYPGAPEENRCQQFEKPLKGYDFAVFGDNHQSFKKTYKSTGTCVINCGCFIRRKSDEIPLEPKMSVLFGDGISSQQVKLDTTQDKFHNKVKQREELAVDMRAFLETLEGLGEHGLDFRKAVINHLKTEEIDTAIKEMVLEALKL